MPAMVARLRPASRFCTDLAACYAEAMDANLERLAAAAEAAIPLLERIARALETHAIIGDALAQTIRRAAEGDEPSG